MELGVWVKAKNVRLVSAIGAQSFFPPNMAAISVNTLGFQLEKQPGVRESGGFGPMGRLGTQASGSRGLCLIGRLGTEAFVGGGRP